MYEYKFVNVELKTTFKGRKPTEDYRRIVEQHAAEGWRLLQIFAPPISGYGVADSFELIFERKK